MKDFLAALAEYPMASMFFKVFILVLILLLDNAIANFCKAICGIFRRPQ